ncbi:hypothetical protein L553_3419 [Bordetella pertussis I036]|nr:hypothetical protein L552_3175 [Bordetella pertussis I002]ETH58609.1 hypothetical protein L553_3419 [Bordetella pertussis I036]ETH61909.1 hypothetical protein L554_3063 [Bordetella pertussis I176]ETH66582.1 hypothetical protein L567_3128 [Bordetella pertussis STO1-CHLA-0006]ETH86042.1 hypothetical protein L560_3376 [Bordetella pertussis STO1-CHOC-0018]ETI00636.1 hypothetical protein L556_0420 [Bordetella pertussis STO1-CHOM-0012]KDD06459.1 hypothetical protein L520_3650 [Bordetella bronchi
MHAQPGRGAQDRRADRGRGGAGRGRILIALSLNGPGYAES